MHDSSYSFIPAELYDGLDIIVRHFFQMDLRFSHDGFSSTFNLT